MSEIIDTRSSLRNCEILIKMRPMSKPNFVTELCPVTLLLMSYDNSQSVNYVDSNPNVVVVLLLDDPYHLDPELLSHYCDSISNPQDV